MNVSRPQGKRRIYIHTWPCVDLLNLVVRHTVALRVIEDYCVHMTQTGL